METTQKNTSKNQNEARINLLNIEEDDFIQFRADIQGNWGQTFKSRSDVKTNQGMQRYNSKKRSLKDLESKSKTRQLRNVQSTSKQSLKNLLKNLEEPQQKELVTNFQVKQYETLDVYQKRVHLEKHKKDVNKKTLCSRVAIPQNNIQRRNFSSLNNESRVNIVREQRQSNRLAQKSQTNTYSQRVKKFMKEHCRPLQNKYQTSYQSNKSNVDSRIKENSKIPKKLPSYKKQPKSTKDNRNIFNKVIVQNKQNNQLSFLAMPREQFKLSNLRKAQFFRYDQSISQKTFQILQQINRSRSVNRKKLKQQTEKVLNKVNESHESKEKIFKSMSLKENKNIKEKQGKQFVCQNNPRKPLAERVISSKNGIYNNLQVQIGKKVNFFSQKNKY